MKRHALTVILTLLMVAGLVAFKLRTGLGGVPGMVGTQGNEETLRWLYEWEWIYFEDIIEDNYQQYWFSTTDEGELPTGAGTTCSKAAPCNTIEQVFAKCATSTNTEVICNFDCDTTPWTGTLTINNPADALYPDCGAGNPCVIWRAISPFCAARPEISLTGSTLADDFQFIGIGGNTESGLSGFAALIGLKVDHEGASPGGDVIDQDDSPVFLLNMDLVDQIGNSTGHPLVETFDGCDDVNDPCGVFAINSVYTALDSGAFDIRDDTMAVVIGDGTMTKDLATALASAYVFGCDDSDCVLIGHDITVSRSDTGIEGSFNAVQVTAGDGDGPMSMQAARLLIHDIYEDDNTQQGSAIRLVPIGTTAGDAMNAKFWQITARDVETGIHHSHGGSMATHEFYLYGSMFMEPDRTDLFRRAIWYGIAGAGAIANKFVWDTSMFEWDGVGEDDWDTGGGGGDWDDHTNWVTGWAAYNTNPGSSISGMIDGNGVTPFVSATNASCDPAAACWGAYTDEYTITFPECIPSWDKRMAEPLCSLRLNGTGNQNIGAR